MFKKKNKTQSSTSTTTVTKYEIKDGQAVFTKSTKTTENGKVVQKSTTSGNVPVKDLKDAVPMLPSTLNRPSTSTYVSPYRNTSSSSSRVTTSTTRLPTTTRIWELPQTKTTTITFEPTRTTKIWELPSTKTYEPQKSTKIWELPSAKTYEPPKTTRLRWETPPATKPPPIPTTNKILTTPKITQSPRPIPPKNKLRPGNVYILNHMKFNNSKNEYRVGSDKDVAELTRTFKQFNMNVTAKSDQKKSEIQTLMNKIRTQDFSKQACIVVVILTHGSRYDMISARDEMYSIDDDVLFPIVQNDTLRGKPKIILVQACKGDREIEFVDSIKSSPGGNPDGILKFYSTFEGYLSYRTEMGSYFIQSFCSNLQKHGHSTDIISICDKVIDDVRYKSGNKQIPTVTKNLTEKFVFGDYK